MKCVIIRTPGGLHRILRGEIGMVLPVDCETVHSDGSISYHCRDYRYPNQKLGRQFQIWSIKDRDVEVLP